MSLNRTKIINYLKEYVAKRNLKMLLAEEVSLPTSLTELVDLIVKDGNNIVFFSVLFQRTLSDPRLRKLIYLEVAKLSKLTSYANKVYLVVPEEYVKPTILDGKLLEDTGVGLISVTDNGVVKEIIPAKPFERELFPSMDKEVKRRLSALEERISRVEEVINKYREELNNVISSIKSLADQLARTRSEIDSIRATISSATIPARVETLVSEVEEGVRVELGEELPSFVKDNPWLYELSKRGKGE